MNEAFEINGFWWLPETPQIQIPGILSFSPGNILILKLMGELTKTPKKYHLPTNFINPVLIHGKSSKGDFVTLYKCFQKSGDNSYGFGGGYCNTEFIAHVAFFGTHFSTQADIQFISLSVRFHNLDNWYNKNLIQYGNPEPGTAVITFKRPAPLDVQLSNFQVQFAVFERQSLKMNNASVYANAWVHIITESQKSFDNYLSLIRLIQNFLTFAITEPTFVIELNGRLTEIIEPVEEKNTPPINIKIFYSAVGWQPDARDVFWADMLLPFSENEKNLPDLLSAWQEKSETLKPVLDLYFAGFYRSTYPENEFINLTQAIETYHRKTYGGQYQIDDVFLNGLYKILIAAIPPDISSDFRSSLKNGKLRYAHEYTLKKRLLLLSEHISDNMSVNFLCDKQTQSAFAEKIADTRNYLTHYSHELKDRAITSGKELFELNQQLGLIIKICLLEELGIPFDRIVALLKRDRSHQKYIA